MQGSDVRIQIKPHGAPTTGAAIPIGAKHAFADCCRIGARLLFVDEAMRNQLMGLLAMAASRMVQLHGLLINGG